MQKKPSQLAKIRENECIGCTKCIQACPVDAIIGAAKQLHTVLVDECVGCKLCIAPCPVDCIDLISVETLTFLPQKSQHRYRAKKQRKESLMQNNLSDRKAYIQAALQRVKDKKGIINSN
jgi:electron transport complex protein RnfB